MIQFLGGTKIKDSLSLHYKTLLKEHIRSPSVFPFGIYVKNRNCTLLRNTGGGTWKATAVIQGFRTHLFHFVM